MKTHVLDVTLIHLIFQHGNTSLHEASWHGFSKTVAALVEHNANKDLKNCAGFAPLHLCCQNGHNQSCRELLIGGADPNIQNNVIYLNGRYIARQVFVNSQPCYLRVGI